MNRKIWVEDWIEKKINDSKHKQKIEDELLPPGFIFNGEDVISLDPNNNIDDF